MKGLLNILNSCFEDVGTKFSELLHKLKNFNSGHFNKLATKGAFTTLSLVLQQNHTLNLQSIVLQIHEALAHFKLTAGAMRLSNFVKTKSITSRIHALYLLKQNVQARKDVSWQSNLELGLHKIEGLLCRTTNRQLWRSLLRWNMFSSKIVGNCVLANLIAIYRAILLRMRIRARTRTSFLTLFRALTMSRNYSKHST